MAWLQCFPTSLRSPEAGPGTGRAGERPVTVDADPQQLDLLDYLRVLWRRKWTVALVVILAVGATLGFSYLQTPRYTATAVVLVQPSPTPSGVNPNAPSNVTPDQVQTQIQVLQSAPVRDAVDRKLGSAPPISVSSQSQTDVINVSATSTDPQRAAAVANAYANAAVDFQRTQTVNSILAAGQQIQSKVNDLDSQISALDSQVSSAPSSQRSSLQASVASQRQSLTNQEAAFKAQLAQVQVNAALTTGGTQLEAAAAAPTAPSSPRTTRNALLALAVGLVLGIGAAFLRDYLDDSLKTKGDLERSGSGLPVLGSIPTVTGWRRGEPARVASMTEPTSHVAEAYRTVRTSIQFLELEHSMKALQVTSPSAAEGKTTTVANLGVVLARAGQRVVILCSDLRRPRIHDFFGLQNKVGFTSVLLGDVPLDQALQPVLGEENLRLLASGPLPPNPSELLVSKRAARLFEELQEHTDLLLVDSPPVLPVTDAAALSAHVDAVLVVATSGTTTRKQFAQALELLDRVKAPLIGTILNEVRGRGQYGYAYQYGYYGAEEASQLSNGSATRTRRRQRPRRAGGRRATRS